MINVAQVRLHYEILNIPIAQLAQENNIPISMLQEEATSCGWAQWWPDSDLVPSVIDVDSDDAEDDESMISQAETFIERAKRRLAVYNIVKEIQLAQKYHALETCIVDTAINTIENKANMEALSISALSRLFKDMTSKSITQALSTLSFGEDEGGLPTVVIKDLSGRRLG